MILAMIDEETRAAQASALCQSCGLCCTGHLFIWAKLKSSELDAMEALGMHVYRADPAQRGFSQPCPLWQGRCTIYHSAHYPKACRSYRCKLLKEMAAENTNFTAARAVIEQAQALIKEVEPYLPNSPSQSFRQRVVALIEHPETAALDAQTYREFRVKAEALLAFFEEHFGVNDFLA